MKKLAGARRAPRRRWAVAIGAGSVLVLVGMIAFAMPAFANHVGNVSGNCTEAVVSWVDFPDNNIPVHIVVNVEGVGSKSVDVTVTNGTPPTHINIENLTSQLNGQTGTVTVHAIWDDFGQHHDEGDEFSVTCGSESTSTMASSSTTAAPTSVPQTTTTTVPVTVTTGGQPTTTVATATTAGGESTTTTSIVTSPETTGLSQVNANESSLPFTGGSSLPLIGVGLALIIGGAAAVIGPRRRS